MNKSLLNISHLPSKNLQALWRSNEIFYIIREQKVRLYMAQFGILRSWGAQGFPGQAARELIRWIKLFFTLDSYLPWKFSKLGLMTSYDSLCELPMSRDSALGLIVQNFFRHPFLGPSGSDEGVLKSLKTSSRLIWASGVRPKAEWSCEFNFEPRSIYQLPHFLHF